MKWTTSWASAASNDVVGERQLLRRPRAGRRRRDAARGRPRRTAPTDRPPRPHRRRPGATSSAVSAPGPQPTSSTRWPAATPARSASCGASSTEYRPMNRSYASAATAKVIGRSLRRADNVSPMSSLEHASSMRSPPRRRSPVWCASTAGHDGRAGEGLRARASRLRDPEHGRHAVRASRAATKGLTALAVVSLIEEGVLELSTTARSVLGDDLPLIDDDVTIEHLLSHRSGIGDYLDEEAELDAHRLRDAGSGARARDDRAVPRGARRAPDQVRARRAVRRTATAATSCSR